MTRVCCIPIRLRDLLLRIAQSGAVQARWTKQILDEMFAALQRNRPDLDPVKLGRTRELMGNCRPRLEGDRSRAVGGRS